MGQGAFPQPRIHGFKAAADLSAKQYHFVKYASTGTDDEQKVVASGAGNRGVGILMNEDATSGRPAEVAMSGGGGKITLAATIALGQYIKSDAAGKGVLVALAGDEIAAKALEAGVSGDVIACDVREQTAHASE